MDEFINELFERTKEELLRNVDKKYHQELLDEYKNYLEKIFNGLKVKDEYYDVALKEEVTVKNKILAQYGANTKLSLYLSDDAYEKLNDLSYKAYQLGIERANKNKISDAKKIEKYKEQMKECLNNVREFNKMRAEMIYGDGLLDFDYASGTIDFYSMRLSHGVINRKEEER